MYIIFSQLCVILEPMQELMSRHKAYALSPRDCLKTTLFQKWQRIVAPPGKRGRRTVALHEKHQPVKPNEQSILSTTRNSFLPISAERCAIIVGFLHCLVAILGSIGFFFSSSSLKPDDVTQIKATSPIALTLSMIERLNLIAQSS